MNEERFDIWASDSFADDPYTILCPEVTRKQVMEFIQASHDWNIVVARHGAEPLKFVKSTVHSKFRPLKPKFADEDFLLEARIRSHDVEEQ